jgi:uncharacterized protein YegL
MTDIPGGAMANRPVHFFWLLDTSSSMGIGGKISTLNFAVHEAIPEMKRVADDNPTAALMVRTLTFSNGARWHRDPAKQIADFTWEDITASGVTDMGAAFRMVAKELQTPPMPARALPPVLALVSDGQPTDDWRGGLAEIDATPWGKRAVRVAVKVGEAADNKDMLQEFLGNPELQPIEANNPAALVAAIRWASTVAVKVASAPKIEGGDGAVNPLAPPTLDGSDEDDVW